MQYINRFICPNANESMSEPFLNGDQSNALDNYSARPAPSPLVPSHGSQSLTYPSHHSAHLSEVQPAAPVAPVETLNVEERAKILFKEIEVKCAGSGNATRALSVVYKKTLKNCLITYLKTHSAPELNEINIEYNFIKDPRVKISFANFDYRINDLGHEGHFAYIPELKRMCLVEGIDTSNGKIRKGKFAYIPELNRMSLVEGTSSKLKH